MSALVDGQLHGVELEQALLACEQDPTMLNRWNDYHLVGELLRGAPLHIQADDAGFLARLRPALHLRQPVPAQALQQSFVQEASNASRWRWAAGFASLVLVAGAAWSLLDGTASDDELVLESSPMLVSSPQGMVLRDAALEELMQAHQQQSGASVLPMPSGFLRNATFEAAPVSIGPAATR